MRYHEIIAPERLVETAYTVYHGTDATFTRFLPQHMGSAHGTAPINMAGFNFTDCEETAQSFGGRVIKATVQITKPLIIDAKGQNYSDFRDTLNSKLYTLDNMKPGQYDGVIIKNYADAGRRGGDYIKSNHYIPFSVSQIQIVPTKKARKPKIVENDDSKLAPTLYHGTCPENAKNLLANGWQPRSGQIGGNMGQARYLYLSTEQEDALWFAQEKGCDAVLALHGIPLSALIVDPEDGIYDTVEEEINRSSGLPGKVALRVAVDASHFELVG